MGKKRKEKDYHEIAKKFNKGDDTYMFDKFAEIHEKYGDLIRKDDDLIRIYNAMLYQVKDHKTLKKSTKKCLEILMSYGIKIEEYEICGLIKKELDRRNKDQNRYEFYR